MTENEYIIMVVRWNEQRRLIKIKINDDINAIEKAISNTYQLQQANSLYENQIQYYDSDHEKFIDLYPDTLHLFQQLLHKISGPEAPPKTAKEWNLKIVSKTVETIRHPVHDSILDDTYSYQQENDPTELLQNEEILSTTANQTNNTHSSSLSSRSGIENPESLPRVPTSLNNDNNQQETTRSNNQSPQLNTPNPELIFTSDHPYSFAFDHPLADHQRKQFEGEMIRKGSQKALIAGVLLRSSHQLDATTGNVVSYPTVHFQIPSDKHHLSWFIHIYILTEPDGNGIHYLHASKGVCYHCTEYKDKSRNIPNTKLVNPCIIQLSKDELRDGIYEIRIKVCNIKNLPTLKHENLREFPRLNDPMNSDVQTLLSAKTTVSLNFSSEKYHIGCILVNNDKAQDRCISSLTIAKSNRKRNQSDKSNQEDDKQPEKKNQRK